MPTRRPGYRAGPVDLTPGQRSTGRSGKKQAPNAESPLRVSTRMRLGYDGLWLATACQWPACRIGSDPVADGPTRTHVRLRRLGESKRKAWTGGCSESSHLPNQNVFCKHLEPWYTRIHDII